jgi:hypothetical protein
MKYLASVLLLFLSIFAQAAPTVGVSAYVHNAGFTSPLTTAGVTTQASGSSFLASATTKGSTATIADNKGNSASYSIVLQVHDTNDDVWFTTWLCTNCAGGSGHTWTVTDSVGPWVKQLEGIEVIGGATSSVIDASNSAFDSGGTSPLSVAVTTTLANDLVIGVIADATSSAFTLTQGAGFTLINQNTTAYSYASAYKAAPTTGSYDPNWTGTASGAATAITLAFKAAGAATPPSALFLVVP